MSKKEIAPGNHEKAWNDPPQLAFSASNIGQSTSNRLRMMKKRIPVPINSTNSSIPLSQEKPLVLNAPPPTCGPPKDLNVSQDCEIKRELKLNTRDDVADIEASLDDILSTLPLDTIETSSKEEIMKRLNTFKEMLTDDKLNHEVIRRMKELISALRSHNCDIAWSLHQTLIVDYTSECSTWMMGIKALIAEARKAHSEGGEMIEENSEITSEKDNTLNQNLDL